MNDKAPAARPTIRDVARQAEVSIGTVSAVINNSGRPVAARTRERVLQAIAELGFEPNNAARSLKSQRISSIGLVAPDLGNAFFADIAEGIQLVLGQSDFLLVLCLTWSDTAREEYYAQVLRTQRLDGVIYLSGTGQPSPSLQALARRGAVVFVDECLPGIPAPFVSAQNRQGAAELARHVLACGHRRLLFISGPRGMWTSEERLSGYHDACRAQGLEPEKMPLLAGDYTEQSGMRLAARILAQPRAEWPTAILCANDLMAIGVIRHCQQQGVAVPGDLSVTGFDDIPAAALVSPPLTTVRQSGHQMGSAAAELLLHRLGCLPEPPAQTDFPATLKLRHSVGKI
ncbi:LacI family DNA-binding transcriptional regulator [Nissabacter sp. SGAir0207]|uniref:LacI family DNA-binding transcriptional regulator n=1 Tax=Nissabacter sp. SGAir0207 TaxID=2126321 RepID=UPI0010CCB981|nr:LacI family DNA-binding transcriptional regulator [Nissabacter sp. SGAir0207]QCR35897.1 LacI family transcriptional regulator [Nissabacter sp. SGAir0207]